MKYLISKVEQFLLDVCCNNYILFFIQIFYDFFFMYIDSAHPKCEE